MNSDTKKRPEHRICVGILGAPHGVKGDIRIKTFTETPEDVAAYGPVHTEDGKRTLTLQIVRALKGEMILAHAPEILHREDAASLTNSKIYVERSVLPSPEDDDEFYIHDLIGLNCVLENGEPAGKIAAVHDFGAGDLLEIKGAPHAANKGGVLVRFTKETVPFVDINQEQIVLAADTFKVIDADQERDQHNDKDERETKAE
ncbi:MAG: ribosome maturation factor RimM [Pseudomonadota bacterium]